MPCSDGNYYHDQLIQQKLDKLTRLLCEACKLIDNRSLTSSMSKELKEWHIQHTWDDLRRGSK